MLSRMGFIILAVALALSSAPAPWARLKPAEGLRTAQASRNAYSLAGLRPRRRRIHGRARGGPGRSGDPETGG